MQVPWSTRVRHYGGLSETVPRLERLLHDFRFLPLAKTFAALRRLYSGRGITALCGETGNAVCSPPVVTHRVVRASSRRCAAASSNEFQTAAPQVARSPGRQSATREAGVDSRSLPRQPSAETVYRGCLRRRLGRYEDGRSGPFGGVYWSGPARTRRRCGPRPSPGRRPDRASIEARLGHRRKGADLVLVNNPARSRALRKQFGGDADL